MTSMIRQRCDKKLIGLYRARTIAAGSAVTAFAGAYSAARGSVFLLIFFTLASAAVTAAAAILLPVRLYSGLGYIRHSDWLYFERCLMTRRGYMIPRSRISCITLRSNPVQRKLGLCTLELSSGGKVFRLPGLALSDAMRMKRLLERRAGY